MCRGLQLYVFLAPHLDLASNSNDNKFVASTFESTETSDEVSNFMTIRGLRNTVSTPTFNRRPAGGYAVEFATSASRCTIVAPVCDLGAGKAFLFSADRNEVIGGHVVADQSTAAPVVFAGVRNRLENVHFYAARGFQINAAANAVEGCTFDSMLGSSGYCLTTTSNAYQAKVIGNRVVGLPSGLGGISFNSDGVCSNNVLSGGGGASVGINVNSANVACVGNYIANFGTALVPNGHLSDSVIANNVGYP